MNLDAGPMLLAGHMLSDEMAQERGISTRRVGLMGSRVVPSRMTQAIIALTLVAALADRTDAATLHVPAEHSTIQLGILNAAPGDTVLVAAGTYTGSFNTDLYFNGKDIVLKSESGPFETEIDCEDSGRGFHIFQGESNQAVIEGFTVRNGGSFGFFISNSSPTVIDCRVVVNNGGVAVQYGSPRFVDCRIANNGPTPRGGGVSVSGTSGTPFFEHCIIEGNEAEESGGGVYATRGTVFLGCTITGNLAGVSGGGVYCTDGDFINCTINSNRTGGEGGGFYVVDGTFEHSIVWDNCADDAGDDLFVTSSAEFSCCALSAAPAGSGSVAYLDEQIFSNPLLCDPEYCGEAPTTQGDYAPRIGSPCLPENSPCGELVGALEVATGECASVGACCYASGSCAIISELICSSSCGEFGGDGTTCEALGCDDGPVGQERVIDRKFPLIFCPLPDSQDVYLSRFTAEQTGAQLTFQANNFFQVDDDTWQWCGHLLDNVIIVPESHYNKWAGPTLPNGSEYRDCYACSGTNEPTLLYGSLAELADLPFADILDTDPASSPDARGWELNGDTYFTTMASAPRFTTNTNDTSGGAMGLGLAVPAQSCPDTVRTSVRFTGLNVGESYVVTAWWQVQDSSPDICTFGPGETTSITRPWLRLTVEPVGTKRLVPAEYPTIQAAIDSSSTGDTVCVAAGTYTGAGNVDLDFGGKDIVLFGEQGPDMTVIDCAGSELEPHRGLIFVNGESPDAVVRGFTIRGGYAPGGPTGVDQRGGAIVCDDGASPTIVDCKLVDNVAPARGGGIYLGDNFNGTLEDLEVRGNQANRGGALHVGLDSSVSISGSLLTGNSAQVTGGGIYCGSSTSITITNTTIASNAALDKGGGIYGVMGAPTMITFARSILWGNCAAEGDELMLGNPDATLTSTCSAIDSSGVEGVGSVDYQGSNVFVDPEFCDPLDCLGLPNASGDYRLGATSPCLPAVSPCAALIGSEAEECAASAVESDSVSTIASPRLSIPFPNPASGLVSYRVDIPHAAQVDLSVVDVTGRKIERLLSRELPPGSHLYTWDTGRKPHEIATGVYFLRLEVNGTLQTEKIVVMR